MKTKPKLDYLFQADFRNGTTYEQGADDESINHPKDAEGNGPSAYRDVLDRLDEVVRFHVVRAGWPAHLVGAHRYTVDLTDGHFEVDGCPFMLERPDVPLTHVRLHYTRHVNVESTIEATMQEDGEWGDQKEVDRAHYVSHYVIGFTAMQGAEEVTYAIAVPSNKPVG